MDAKPIDVLVLGATGYTGRLVTRYLNSHPQRASFTFATAARSPNKLAALYKELSLDEKQVPQVQVDVTREDELEAAVKMVKVVINTVGPYWKWGTPVVKLCVRHHVHHVDLTGETHWIKQIVEEFDYAAHKSGTVIIPSCGFDSVPSDLSAYVSSKTIKSLAGQDSSVDESLSAFKFKGGLSGGSLASAFNFIEEVPKKYKVVAAADYAISPVSGPPVSRPKLIYKIPHVQPPIFGSFFFMSPSNRALVQRSWGLLQRHASLNPTDKNIHTYGENFKYDEFIRTRGSFSALGTSLAILGALILLLLPPVRWAIKKWGPQPGEGPPEENLESGSFSVTNISTSKSAHSKLVVKTTFHGQGDPGYLLTSMMISECALSLILEPRKALPPLGQQGGVLTPATALGDVLVKRLESTGRFRFESKRV